VTHTNLGWTPGAVDGYLEVSISRCPTLAEQSLRPNGRSVRGRPWEVGKLTSDPHFFSAHHTYLPNLKRVRHSPTLNSSTSFSSSAEERHRRFCWNKTINAARTVRCFSDVNCTICPRFRRPRVSKVEATLCGVLQVRVFRYVAVF